MKALYKLPQAAFPYDLLVEENRRRSKIEPEFELWDTGVCDGGRYFDVIAEYAKASPNDILIRVTVANRGPEASPLDVLPTLWFPVNYLLVVALERYHRFYGETLRVECPTGSGVWMDLAAVAKELYGRLARIFLPGPDGARPCHGGGPPFDSDPNWRDLLLFHEYFHGDTGRGLGASHQTGWTALVIRCLGKT